MELPNTCFRPHALGFSESLGHGEARHIRRCAVLLRNEFARGASWLPEGLLAPGFAMEKASGVCVRVRLKTLIWSPPDGWFPFGHPPLKPTHNGSTKGGVVHGPLSKFQGFNWLEVCLTHRRTHCQDPSRPGKLTARAFAPRVAALKRGGVRQKAPLKAQTFLRHPVAARAELRWRGNLAAPNHPAAERD